MVQLTAVGQQVRDASLYFAFTHPSSSFERFTALGSFPKFVNIVVAVLVPLFVVVVLVIFVASHAGRSGGFGG